MNQSAFIQIRHRLGKTQAELAKLLGVSVKAIQSFEQGWRNVPCHIERQMLLLLALKHEAWDESEPCWKRTNCSTHLREACMAWEVQAGYMCWFVNGTVCRGVVHDTWEEKMEVCKGCEVFQSVVSADDLYPPGGEAA